MIQKGPHRAGGCATSGRSPTLTRVGVVASLLFLALLAGCATSDLAEEKARRDRASAIRDVAIDHLNHGRTAMAIRKLQEAQIEDPTDPIVYHGLGEAYRRKGLLDEAERYFLKSLGLSENTQDVDHQRTVLTLGVLYIQQERYEEARVQSQLLVDDPTYSSPWLALTNRGWAEYRMGRLDLARQSYEEALEYDPAYGTVHLNLGRVEQDERHWLPAIQQFELALKSRALSPLATAELNYRLAESYLALDRKDDATPYFRETLKLDPYGKWGERAQSYLDLLK